MSSLWSLRISSVACRGLDFSAFSPDSCPTMAKAGLWWSRMSERAEPTKGSKEKKVWNCEMMESRSIL